MKLWEKGIKVKDEIILFTAGKDRLTDVPLAPFDIIGSIAHVIMLESIKILSFNEKNLLIKGLLEIYKKTVASEFNINEGIEDVHSQLEKMLTEMLGEPGKKIHTARSRNDQIITCLKLYYREQLSVIFNRIELLIEILLEKSEVSKEIIIPGYTHTQSAMPSSAGLWFGAYAESLTEDLFMLNGAFKYTNQSPLGSAAGYGSSFPINRELTCDLLEFDSLHVNSINAQLSRGKTERYVMMAVTGVANTLAKLADDMVMFLCQNFDFMKLSDDLTTGSSIMPHKKNPDVLELVRGKCNAIQGKLSEVMFITSGLTSGYHRDLQLLKQPVAESLEELIGCLDILCLIFPGIMFNENIMDKDIYKNLWSVDAINEKVQEGIPFRDAYNLVALEINKGRFRPGRPVKHTHTGSIGNLSNNKIKEKLIKFKKETKLANYLNFRERFIEKILKENGTQKQT